MPTLAAWAVHILTASSGALALFAAVAVAAHAWQAAFLLLGMSLILDGIDGPLARAFAVKERLPWIDGVMLDLVVDYGTYVLVPAMILVVGPLLSPPYGAIAGIAVAVAGPLYFADTRMKTSSDSFRGFPGVWNGVVYLLMVYRPPEIVTLAVIAGCVVLTFAHVEFVHPVRVRRWRPLTLSMTAAWAALAVVTLLHDLNPPLPVAVAFAIASLYFAAVGAVQQLTR
jgi:phosphatidylcholine synthase